MRPNVLSMLLFYAGGHSQNMCPRVPETQKVRNLNAMVFCIFQTSAIRIFFPPSKQYCMLWPTSLVWLSKGTFLFKARAFYRNGSKGRFLMGVGKCWHQGWVTGLVGWAWRRNVGLLRWEGEDCSCPESTFHRFSSGQTVVSRCWWIRYLWPFATQRLRGS